VRNRWWSCPTLRVVVEQIMVESATGSLRILSVVLHSIPHARPIQAPSTTVHMAMAQSMRVSKSAVLTKCNTDKDGNASFGSDACNYIRSKQRCSSHFPEKCGLQKNSIYQCSSTREPQLVSSCGDDKACVTLSDGAICKSKDRTCSVDGESFHPSCHLSATILYTCTMGQAM